MTIEVHVNFDLKAKRYRSMGKYIVDLMFEFHKRNPGLSALPDTEIRKLIAAGKVKGVK